MTEFVREQKPRGHANRRESAARSRERQSPVASWDMLPAEAARLVAGELGEPWPVAQGRQILIVTGEARDLGHQLYGAA